MTGLVQRYWIRSRKGLLKRLIQHFVENWLPPHWRFLDGFLATFRARRHYVFQLIRTDVTQRPSHPSGCSIG